MDTQKNSKNLQKILSIKPNDYYLSEKFKRQCLRLFLKTHRAFFGYDWGMEKWTTMYVEAIFEAHEATVDEFEDYIKGNKPFLLKHYFKISYIKKMVKKLLCRRRG